MHPPLGRPHPDCQAVIDALVACHNNFPYAKFAGKCNDEKAAMDICFRAEKEVKRSANASNGRKFTEQFETRMVLLERAKAYHDELKKNESAAAAAAGTTKTI